MNKPRRRVAALPGALLARLIARAGKLQPAFSFSPKALGRVMLVGALAGGPIAIAFGLFIVVQNEAERLSNSAEAIISTAEAREREIIQTFAALDRLQNPVCGDADLKALRSLVISSEIIQDIARREAGRLICSAVYDTKEVQIPALRKPGYVLSPEQTFWRDASLPSVPGHNFLVVAHRGFVLVVRPTPGVGFGDRRVEITRFVVNRQSGAISWLVGPPIDAPARLLHDHASLWRHGRLAAVSCVHDQTICLALSAPWQDVLRSNAKPFGMFAMAGALIGSATSVMFMAWQQQRRLLYRRLQRAIRMNELIIVYQPIVSASNHAIMGAEALMRWPVRGGTAIPPDVFIPAAEDAGLVGALTRFAITTVSRDLKDLLAAHENFYVGINIVADDLDSAEFHATLASAIEAQGIRPAQIALELTERRAAQVEAADRELDQLRRRGYKIYIDDFGTGYSSLTYLTDLAIDAIKLDRSFTSTVDTQAARSRLVPPIMDLARDLGLPVIVEGVETESQAAHFRARGAAFLQGWLFSRAIAADELIRRVNDEANRALVEAPARRQKLLF
jgi:sensor c-di-GMP phosphodiesterase-like protein